MYEKWDKSFWKCWVWQRKYLLAGASDESYEHENSKLSATTGWTNDLAIGQVSSLEMLETLYPNRTAYNHNSNFPQKR